MTTHAQLLRGMRERAEAAEQEVERLRLENQCNACAGTGFPTSGLPCMCGGTGKMSDAAVHLQQTLLDGFQAREINRLEREVDRLRREVEDLKEDIARIPQWPGA